MITLSTLDVLLGGPRQNIAMRFGMEKRTMSQWLLGGEFFLRICLLASTQYTTLDGQNRRSRDQNVELSVRQFPSLDSFILEGWYIDDSVLHSDPPADARLRRRYDTIR